MNDRNRVRMLIGIIIALVLLNAGLLTWMWLGSQRHHREGDGRSYLSKTLGFSEEQRTKYRAMRQNHFKTIRPLLDSMRQERQRFFRQVNDSTQTDAQLTQQARQLEEYSVRLDVLTLRHFQQVSALCTPEQRQKLQKVLADRPGFGSFSGSGWSGKHRSDSSRRDRSEK
ncbi:Spy/CpxP family protein refolding chaperone [Larkinella sp. GY13]|uniref:Spy/CpxP family protein refolding chaperone n=1 Tax=Larkinella sp. GY13 TaxID=3453720 RepID=UPI003EE86136